jgi:hypothetical protein
MEREFGSPGRTAGDTNNQWLGLTNLRKRRDRTQKAFRATDKPAGCVGRERYQFILSERCGVIPRDNSRVLRVESFQLFEESDLLFKTKI